MLRLALLHCLFFGVLFMSVAGVATAQSQYPERVKQQYVNECMNQPIPFAVDIPKAGRYKHCLCTFNYIKGQMSYTEYQSFEQTLQSQGPEAVPQSYMKIMEDGTTQCAKRYLMGVGKIK